MLEKHESNLREAVVRSEEVYLMMCEEDRSYKAELNRQDRTTELEDRIHWIRRLLNTVNIEKLEAEGKLREIEANTHVMN